MDRQEALDQDPGILHLLQAGERVELGLDASDYELRVTDRRLLLLSGGTVLLDMPFQGLRRIQFDIQAERPATLVIVPHMPADEPRVLAVPPEAFQHAGELLAFVGKQLHRAGRGR